MAINNDDVSILVADSVVFQEPGNIVELSGVVTTSGIYVTGFKTDFISEIRGRTVVKIDGQYRVVVGVPTMTTAVLDAPLSSDITAPTPIAKIAVDVCGIPSQQYGVQVADNPNNVLIDIDSMPPQASGHFFHIADDQLLHLRPGSRIKMRSRMSVVGEFASQVLAGVPGGFRVVALKMDVAVAISGDGVSSLHAEMRYADETIVEVYAKSLPLSVGTALNTSVYGAALSSTGKIVIVCNDVPRTGEMITSVTIERVGTR